jgi:hypothetical protein
VHILFLSFLNTRVYRAPLRAHTAPAALKAVGHLKAVCLLRPTADNIALLIKQLKEPRFASYHLCASLPRVCI